MQETAFQPNGPTYSISGSPVQILSSVNLTSTAYRIRNLTSGTAYFSWSAPLSVSSPTAPTITTTSPAVGSPPSINTLGMVSTSIEVFRLPQQVWIVSLSGNAFEVTPGEGV